MQELTLSTQFSQLSIHQGQVVSQLPPEILFNIFSRLNESSLRNASWSCRNWRAVATDSRLWRRIAPTVYPEQARFFELLCRQTEHPINWHEFILRQYQGARLLRSLPTRKKSTEQTTHTQIFTKRYVDIDGTQYRAKDGLIIKAYYPSGKTKYSVKDVLPKQYHAASFTLCSIRTTKVGKIALLRLTDKKIHHIVTYNFDRQYSQVVENADYLSSGGTNLGLGGLVRGASACSQSRQQMPEESLSPLFCTTTTPQAFRIHTLDSVKLPLVHFRVAEGEVIQHVDTNPNCLLMSMTIKETSGQYRHQLLAKNNQGNYDPYSNLNVLAFDSKQSLAVVQLLSNDAPIRLVQLIETNGKIQLNFHDLFIEPSEQYSAQIKENYLAVMTKNQSSSALFLFLLEVGLPSTHIALTKVLPTHTIESFTLYEDYLVLLSTTMNDKPGPLVVYDLHSLKPTPITQAHVTGIIGREARTLLCQTVNGLLAVNLANHVVSKVSDSSRQAVYQSRIFELNNYKSMIYAS